MKVRLEGTGTPPGLPVEGCPCVTCRAALVAGHARRPLRVVVDGRRVLTAQGAGSGPEVAPAGPGSWSVTCGGEQLLWSPAGALPQQVAGSYAVVLLGVGEGLASWPLRVAELRRAGAVDAGTRLLAVAVGHTEPTEAELSATLALWGARAPLDGDEVDTGLPVPGPLRGRRSLVLGGARSGKSAHAELRVAAEPAVRYVATAPPRPGDLEWQARIRAHAARRPPAWRTVETTDVAAQLAVPGAVLIDDLGLWLTHVLDRADAWAGPVPAAVDADLDELVRAWAGRTSGVAVLVAPEVGGGVVPDTASGRRFRDLLGQLTAALASHSDDVVQVVAGLPRSLR